MSRLLGDVRRGATQRRRNRRSASLNFFVNVTPGRPIGRRRRGNDKGDTAGTATSLDFSAGIGLRRSRMQTVTGHTRGATPPRRHFVRLLRACLCLFLRVVDSAEQITELGRLTRALVRFPRRRRRLLRAIGRFWRSENGGRVPGWLGRSIVSPPLICGPPE